MPIFCITHYIFKHLNRLMLKSRLCVSHQKQSSQTTTTNHIGDTTLSPITVNVSPTPVYIWNGMLTCDRIERCTATGVLTNLISEKEREFSLSEVTLARFLRYVKINFSSYPFRGLSLKNINPYYCSTIDSVETPPLCNRGQEKGSGFSQEVDTLEPIQCLQ